MPKIRSDLLALVLFCASLLLLAFAYGVAVGRLKIFPYVVMTDAVGSAKAMRTQVNRRKVVALQADHLLAETS